MRVQSMHFHARAHGALEDARLQSVLKRFGSGFAEKRAAAREAYSLKRAVKYFFKPTQVNVTRVPKLARLGKLLGFTLEDGIPKPLLDLSEEQLDTAMNDLGIEGQEPTDQEIAQLEAEEDKNPSV